MSGKGRGGGGANNTMRSVANALGIARYDMAKMMSQQKVEPPQLYPKVQRDPVPLEMTTDMLYVSRLKVELDQRMRDSKFFIEAERGDEIKRYLDKYSVIKREKLKLDLSQMPSELTWRRSSAAKRKAAKKRKIAADDLAIKEKLKKLEEKEDQTNEDDEDEKPDRDNDTGSEKSVAEEEENPLSDDDNQEEDNDYISNYFDNGEGYGDGGSDDNMDGDEY